jgi:hypothetical protein
MVQRKQSSRLDIRFTAVQFTDNCTLYRRHVLTSKISQKFIHPSCYPMCELVHTKMPSLFPTSNPNTLAQFSSCSTLIFLPHPTVCIQRWVAVPAAAHTLRPVRGRPSRRLGAAVPLVPAPALPHPRTAVVGLHRRRVGAVPYCSCRSSRLPEEERRRPVFRWGHNGRTLATFGRS